MDEPRSGAFRAIHRAATIGVFGVLPAAVVAAVLTASFVRGPFVYDFHGGLYGAGHDVAHGHDPYRAGYLARQALAKRHGDSFETVIDVPVYPAPALVAAVPFSLLPFKLAGILFVLLSIAGLLIGLRLLGVRDWRCYGVAFASWPVIHGLMLGALTPLLVLGAGLVWHYRRDSVKSAAALAAVVVAKLFLWPLAVWALIRRRRRTLFYAAVLGLVAGIAGWACIGFTGLTSYPHMLGDLTFVSEDVGVSVVAALLALGLPAGFAHAAALVLAAALLLYARRLNDRRAFGLAILAALVASPIVWPHYFALVFVPIALVAPSLSALWFVPLLTDVYPLAQTGRHPWVIALYLGVTAATAAALARAAGPEPAALPARA